MNYNMSNKSILDNKNINPINSINNIINEMIHKILKSSNPPLNSVNPNIKSKSYLLNKLKEYIEKYKNKEKFNDALKLINRESKSIISLPSNIIREIDSSLSTENKKSVRETATMFYHNTPYNNYSKFKIKPEYFKNVINF